MWNRKKHRIAELEAYRLQLVQGRQAAIEEALDKARALHAKQYELLADKNLDLEAGAKRVADQNKVLREENAELRKQVATLQSHSALAALDAEYEQLDGRLHRALRACARYRRDASMLSSLLRTQQRQLDDALGMDHDPRVAAGADWQSRRPDKPVTASALYTPSAQMPTQEPGLARHA